jgi:hypothetical protein
MTVSCLKQNILISFLTLTFTYTSAQSATDTASVNRKQLRNVIIFESATAVTTLAGLSVLWYSDYPQSSFHFINDNGEWMQLDKCGHMTSSYYIGKIGYELLRIPGVEKKKAVWYGGTLGFAYLGIVEVMDGFSTGWGASAGDLAANALGSAAFISQQLVWDEQKILLKWSFHKSRYAAYNPDQLGKTYTAQMIKDYNGQTFWLSGNIRSFLKEDSNFPRWINIAFGYGAEGLVGARSNPPEINGMPVPPFDRYRQFYIAPDIDLTRIRTKSTFLRMVFNIFGVLKFPLPTVEYNSVQGFVFHPIYF